MSLGERTGIRDLAYSQWHRFKSIKRYLDLRTASTLKVIDIDWCEYCHYCHEPLALIETQRSAREPKAAEVTANLARRADIPAYTVSYRCDETDDPVVFRVRDLSSTTAADTEMDAEEYALFLGRIHASCPCITKETRTA